MYQKGLLSGPCVFACFRKHDFSQSTQSNTMFKNFESITNSGSLQAGCSLISVGLAWACLSSLAWLGTARWPSQTVKE